MADVNQVQIRRDTAAAWAGASAPAQGELIFETDTKQVAIGDGSTVGGVPVNSVQAQKQKYVYATNVAGTANAITADLAPAPSAYAAGMRIALPLASTITAAATLNLNGLGARSIKVMGPSGLRDPKNQEFPAGTILGLTDNGTYLTVTEAPQLGGVVARLAITAQAYATFETGIDAASDIFRLDIASAVPGTDTVDLLLEMQIADSPDWQVASADYAYTQNEQVTNNVGSSSNSPTGSNGAAAIKLNGAQQLGTAAGEKATGWVEIYRPAAGNSVQIAWLLNLKSSAGAWAQVRGMGEYKGSTSAVTGVRLRTSSGNLDFTGVLRRVPS